MLRTTSRTVAILGFAAAAVMPLLASTRAAAQSFTTSRTSVESGVTDPGELERLTEERRSALAAVFREQAVQLHSRPDRWDDAATFHYFSALYRGMQGEEAARDLLLAGNLFQASGQSERACAVLEKAASIHLIEGRREVANTLFLIAASVDRLSCAARWDEIFEGIEIPPPGGVSVAPADAADGPVAPAG